MSPDLMEQSLVNAEVSNAEARQRLAAEEQQVAAAASHLQDESRSFTDTVWNDLIVQQLPLRYKLFGVFSW